MSSARWAPGEPVQGGGVELGDLTYWELLLLSPTAASLIVAELPDERQQDVVDSIRTSLEARRDESGEVEAIVLPSLQRAALDGRRQAYAGLTIRGPAPTSGVCFEAHVANDFAIVDQHDEYRVRFRAFDRSEWARWLGAQLIHSVEAAPQSPDFTPVFMVRCFSISGETIDFAESVIGSSTNGLGIAVEDDEGVELFDVTPADLVAYLGNVGWIDARPSDPLD